MNDAEILDISIKAVKIEVSNAERETLLEEVRKVQEWLQPLLQLETSDTKPTYNHFKEGNVFREDKPVSIPYREALTGNSGSFVESFYRVPPVIEDQE